MRVSQKVVLDRAQSALAMLRRLSIREIVTLVVCIGFGIVGIYYAATINSDLPLSDGSAVAMVLGVVFTLALGVGLMTLIFFSSRRGFDDPPEVQADSTTKTDGRPTPRQ